jgi:aryl-alcohol dehydrogenase-like predicted oxidoreductase
MEYRTLGSTGLSVGRVAFGVSGLEDPRTLYRALDLGINWFDSTANCPADEALVREVVARPGTVAGNRSYARTAAALQADLDASLRRLGREYLDIWYLGGWDAPVPEDLLEVQGRAVRAGKVRYRGLSTHRPGCHALGRFDVVLTPYNFLLPEARIPVAPCAFAAIKPMAGGYRASGAALRYVLRHPRIGAALTRMITPAQVEANVRAAAEPWTADDARQLAADEAAVSDRMCRFCGECAHACPRGLNPGFAVRCLMYVDSYGQPGMGLDQWRRQPAAVRAVRCAECAACPVECRHGVHLRELATRAQRVFEGQ